MGQIQQEAAATTATTPETLLKDSDIQANKVVNEQLKKFKEQTED